MSIPKNINIASLLCLENDDPVKLALEKSAGKEALAKMKANNEKYENTLKEELQDLFPNLDNSNSVVALLNKAPMG